jgi:lysozyme
MAISKKAIDLVKHYESLHDGNLTAIGIQPKMDPIGIWTIGWGHAIVDPVTKKQLKGAENYARALALYPGFDERQSEDLLMRDLAAFELAVRKLVTVPLNEDQVGALTAFAFNIGASALASSTALKHINSGNIPEGGEWLLKWNKATVNGVKVELKGLTYRRMSERDLLVKGELRFYNV